MRLAGLAIAVLLCFAARLLAPPARPGGSALLCGHTGPRSPAKWYCCSDALPSSPLSQMDAMIEQYRQQRQQRRCPTCLRACAPSAGVQESLGRCVNFLRFSLVCCAGAFNAMVSAPLLPGCLAGCEQVCCRGHAARPIVPAWLAPPATPSSSLLLARRRPGRWRWQRQPLYCCCTSPPSRMRWAPTPRSPSTTTALTRPARMWWR